MAQAEPPKILERLTDDQMGKLPARRDVPAEPREPAEPRQTRETETGRRPEEVVTHEDRQPTPTKDEDGKPKKPVLKFRGEDLTFDEIIKRGLTGDLQNALITADQFPALQKKYTESLEEKRATPPATPAAPVDPAKAQAEAIKQHQEGTLQVLQNYAPVADHEIKFYMEKGLLEPDFVEMYPNAVRSVFSILLYHMDEMDNTKSRNEWSIEWIESEKQFRNALKAVNMQDSAINAVAAKADDSTDDAGKVVKGDKVFEGLKNPETRKAFVEWLKKEIDPKVGALKPENIERFWMAFIGKDLLKFAKEAATKEDPTPSTRKRAASDGSPNRSGIKETPAQPGVLDGLINQHLGISAEDQ